MILKSMMMAAMMTISATMMASTNADKKGHNNPGIDCPVCERMMREMHKPGNNHNVRPDNHIHISHSRSCNAGWGRECNKRHCKCECHKHHHNMHMTPPPPPPPPTPNRNTRGNNMPIIVGSGRGH